ncbi:hypothetical protein NW759_000194 [Fusarium solani]|nr:hypothetical protein NW759_000194 [Fusarium solani]
MMGRSESPAKKRRTEAPVKEEPIIFKGEEHTQCKEEETKLTQLSQLLREIRKITRRNEALAELLDETLEETRKLRTHLDYLKVLPYLKATNPIFKSIGILVSPRKGRPAKLKSPKKRANKNSG